MTRFKGEVLKKLRQEQVRFSKKVVVEDDFGELVSVGGVDVAFDKKRNKAYSACVVLDFVTGDVIEKRTATGAIPMPYIPTYLTFRELPTIERVFRKKIKRRPTILMVDGNGILHPLGIGLASHVGVKLGIPTIGVAKKRLLGIVEGSPRPGKEAVPMSVEGRHVGYAMVPTMRCKRSIYISPGHRVSLLSSVNIVKRFCNYRIPEPIRQADILSRKKKQRK